MPFNFDVIYQNDHRFFNKVFRALFLGVCFLSTCFSFAPRTEKIYHNNLSRLLHNSQYSYAVEYYLKYASLFETNQSFIAYSIRIADDIPLKEEKKKIYTYLLKNRQKQKNYDDLYLRLGQLFLFENKPNKALNYLKLIRERDSIWYRILAYYHLKDTDNFFLLVDKLEKNKSFVDSKTFRYMFLLKAEMYLYFKKPRLAYEALVKSGWESAERAILLHQIYRQTKESQKERNLLSILKKKYKNNPKVKNYLKKLNK